MNGRTKIVTVDTVEDFNTLQPLTAETVIDGRSLDGSDIVDNLGCFYLIMVDIHVTHVWLDVPLSRFIEIKERLKKKCEKSLLNEMTLTKMTLQGRDQELGEALKCSKLVASIPNILHNLPELAQMYPGLVQVIQGSCKRIKAQKEPSVGALKRKHNDQGMEDHDTRRPKRKTFNVLRDFKLGTHALSTCRASYKCYMCRVRGISQSQGRLCGSCRELNLKYLNARVSLDGRYGIVTGGRIKIGFEVSLRLLRDGCQLIVTSRFPQDALKRFQGVEDYESWENRLQVAYLNLEDMTSVKKFLDFVHSTVPHLDILVNNAAQTIHRPHSFYQEIEVNEALGVTGVALPRPTTNGRSKALTLMGETRLPENPAQSPLKDKFGQPLDPRPRNSWTYNLNEVPLSELIQVLTINSVGPFILCSQLKPLLQKSPFKRKFVLNVSAMEGQFSRGTKGQRHPHTNMAKAALNMMTRTSGLEFQLDGIFMTSVDTGWVTDERPLGQAIYEAEQGFTVPLDCKDGAARVYHPVIHGLDESTEHPYFAVFLKDYQVHPW